MTVLGHTIPWGTHAGAGRTTDAKGWYAHMKMGRAARKAARREALCTPRASTASDMGAPSHAHFIAMAFRDLGV